MPLADRADPSRRSRPGRLRPSPLSVAASDLGGTGDDLTGDEVRDILTRGELDIAGRLTDASNVTVLATATLDGASVYCVYKPVRGERPLWDFPDGTLAGREVASAMIAGAAGWDCVPPTFLRETGPLGVGMVQRWIECASPDTLVDLHPVKKLPTGWLPVLRAIDAVGDPVVLAHADDPGLKLLATFDLVVNNADRKGSHVLPVPGGPVYGVDHGLTLHVETKLRTVLWGWAGTALDENAVEGLRRITGALDGPLGEALSGLLTSRELTALQHRLARLVRKPVFDTPPEHRTPIPWPPL